MGHIDLFSFTRKIGFMRDELHYVDSVEKTLVEENPDMHPDSFCLIPNP